MRWIPFLGFRSLDDSEVAAFDLEVGPWEWCALVFEWMDWGYVLFAWPRD